jgi:hypothetical protein
MGHFNFEKELVEIMIDEECTMSTALNYAFSNHKVDTSSVITIVDFLEEMLYDLDKVEFFMKVYTGQVTDLHLVEMIDNEKKEDKGHQS